MLGGLGPELAGIAVAANGEDQFDRFVALVLMLGWSEGAVANNASRPAACSA